MIAALVATLPDMPMPVLVLAAGILVLLLAIACRGSRPSGAAGGTDDRTDGGTVAGAIISAATIALAFIGLWSPASPPSGGMARLFAADAWFAYGTGLILLSSGGILAMSWRRMAGERADEAHLLLLLGTLGAVVAAGSANAVAFFVGLETLSLSLLGLIAYRPRVPDAAEAAMKYLVLSGTSSAILLFGLALAYAETGDLRFTAPPAANPAEPALAVAATILVLTGLFFKLSAAPFHLWLADVLDGAPTPVSAFVAVVSKIALFVALARYFAMTDLTGTSLPAQDLAVVAVLSMVGGNLLAFGQTNLKRLLAGSSIAHVGYLLVALLSAGPFGAGSAAFYLAAYAAATLGAFAALGAGPDRPDLAAWRGMFHRRPALALALSVMLLSLAGIPPAVGFFAKAYIVAAGVSAHRMLLLAALIVSSIIGLCYYLNVARIMMAPAPDTAPAMAARSGGTTVLLAALALATLLIGLFPGPLVQRTTALFLPAVPATETAARARGPFENMRW
ncbi:NADH-quinone oxidoreductase subunit N [Gluconacetobacter tumulisoli]|uniref:NADH-quinone oxidoreductase subunit N n=1 Tax=Gluconacetobacter tumulisoli TaxID=1286189 RepID=A0A7W4K517_9PROT|nr:NADH-quinone oxidoreductase subunit N [Gluconacetobacter tumulisoli]MBB2200536.1 NADH-quinone oxidoreductase subunit N [Gluconacetobacter tumulisoli]